MILIDTHFHIEKDSDLEKIVNDAKKEDVLYLILGGNSKEDNLLNIKACKNYKSFGVIHCFSESKEVANEYIKLGYKLGIGGVLTFKNSNLKDVIKDIPLENIVLETDSPFLSPIRGSVNEPKNIKLIAECLSNIKNITISEVAKKNNR